MSNKIAILYTTVSTIEAAEQLANLALFNNTAACANIIPNGKSIYLWNGKIEQNTECYIIFKTAVEKMHVLEQLIIENHPYDIPAILKFNAEVSEEFFSYVTQHIKYHA